MRPDIYEASGESHPRTVLIAEEDAEMREILVRELRADGYQVIALEDGLEVCDYLERAQFSNGNLPQPDLILSDARLSGYGGLEICRMVSAEKPFILLAPHDDPDSWGGAEEAGACHVLDVPLDISELHNAIACYLEDEP
jgi:CheY-like chemotaxis protein